MKVKLADGIKRWHYDKWRIARGEIRDDCTPEIFACANGILVEVKEEKKTIQKSKSKKEDVKFKKPLTSSDNREEKEVKL